MLSAVGRAFQNLYRAGMITKEGLKHAVSDGVLTPEEYEIITGEPYTE